MLFLSAKKENKKQKNNTGKVRDAIKDENN